MENFEASHGPSLLQRDIENYSRNQVYRTSQVPVWKIDDPDAVRLSVNKELWFPILRNYTGLIMVKNEVIRNEALESLEKTLEEHHAYFGEDLWREILSQVLLPVFEDIRLQVELFTKKNNLEQANHFIKTLKNLLASLNSFLKKN